MSLLIKIAARVYELCPDSTKNKIKEFALSPMILPLALRVRGYFRPSLHNEDGFTKFWDAAKFAVPSKIPSDEDWRALIKKQSEASGSKVQIIIPVYKGYEDTINAIYSVIKAVVKTPYELIVIDDASPDVELAEKLVQLSGQGLFRLIRHSSNLGFVSTANEGMLLDNTSDVVLLNSDTEVYDGWLDRLMASLYADKRNGTAMPLSNNAEIASYPFMVKNNYFDLEIPFCELDKMAAENCADSNVEAPTSVGFCMAIRRECINEVGVFDVESFGRGYGEENDFCQRAIKHNWKNILTHSVFVRHVGGSSFGDEKSERIERAMNILAKKYPLYHSDVRKFIIDDVGLKFRQMLDVARIKRSHKKPVLYINHLWGGGTEKHVRDMAMALKNEGRGAVIMRPHQDPSHAKINLTAIDVLPTPNLVFGLNHQFDELIQCLKELEISHIHVHQLISYNKAMDEWILKISEALGLKYDVTLHDYYPICPRINLIDASNLYCGEPGEAGCNKCLSKNPPDDYKDTASISDWYKKWEFFLGGARKIYVPNIDVSKRFNRYFPALEFTVRNHLEPVSTATIHVKPEAGSVIKIATIGGIGISKGVMVFHGLGKDGLSRNLPVEYSVIGYSMLANTFQKHPNMKITGGYHEEDLMQLINNAAPDLVFFASVWPETYSYTLSTCYIAGLYPVAFDIGAMAERIKQYGVGSLIPFEYATNARKLNDELIRIASEIKNYKKPLSVDFSQHNYNSIWHDYYGW